jgi:hypothetical protein
MMKKKQLRKENDFLRHETVALKRQLGEERIKTEWLENQIRTLQDEVQRLSTLPIYTSSGSTLPANVRIECSPQ